MENEKRLIDANALLQSEVKRCRCIPTIGSGYSNEIGLIMQGFSEWEKQPNPKRFKQFGLQKWWRKNGWASESGEEMLPL